METWKISHWQAMGFLISAVFATSILYVPGIVAAAAGPNGWLSVVIALVINLVFVSMACSLGLKHPNKTVIVYAVDILGFPLGKLVGFMYVYYFLFNSSVILREFIDLVGTAYMNKTPPLVLGSLLILLACLAMYLGLEVIVRANSIILLINILTIIIIFLVFIWSAKLALLKPDFSKGFGPIIYGSLSPIDWLSETVLILWLIPFIQNKANVKATSLLAVFIVFIMLEAVIVLTVANLGLSTTSRANFPLFSLLAKPPEFIQNFIFQPSGFFMPVWVAGMLMKLTTFFFTAVYGLAQWFDLQCYRHLVLPAGALVLVLSIASFQNIIAFLDFSKSLSPYAIFTHIVLTFFLYSVSLIRHKDKNTKGRA